LLSQLLRAGMNGTIFSLLLSANDILESIRREGLLYQTRWYNAWQR
jgi:hypothetical protein